MHSVNMKLTNKSTKRKQYNWSRLVKKYRLSLGVSMEEFGKVYGVTRQAVFKWEAGDSNPPIGVCLAILEWVKGREQKSLQK